MTRNALNTENKAGTPEKKPTCLINLHHLNKFLVEAGVLEGTHAPDVLVGVHPFGLLGKEHLDSLQYFDRRLACGDLKKSDGGMRV